MTTHLAPRIHPALVNFVRPSEHSTYSPSAAERWMACAYSIAASEGIPEEENDFSAEGTLAHSICEAVFQQEYYYIDFPMKLQAEMISWDMENLKRKKKMATTTEMLEYAHQYVEVITYYLNNKTEIGTVIWFGLEKGVPIFPEKGCFGTGDCIIVGTLGCAIIDFKFGRGKNVDPQTLQLKVYAAGVFRHLENVPAGYKFIAVIFQPRIHRHAKSHEYTAADMNQCLGDIWHAILATENRDAQPITGNHCFWCPAKRTHIPEKKCTGVKAAQAAVAGENFAHFFSMINAPVADINAPNTQRDQALIKLITLYPMIKDAVENAKEEFAYRITKQQEYIPGIKIAMKEGNREMKGESDQDIAAVIMSKFQGVNPWKEVPATTKLKSLTEMEKEYGIKLDSICTRKLTHNVEILDERSVAILGELARFGMNANYGQGQED